jgi:formate-dependent nitrite reductase membrane component NrfD
VSVLLAEHFTQPPEWRWYILAYFFLAGLAGGCYALGTMLRLWGRGEYESAARLCFLLTLPLVAVCPILLTVDLGQPLRFWHMMVDTGVEGPGLNFRYWSPMSLGVWALAVFGVFAAISFLEAAALQRRVRSPLDGRLVRLLGGPLGSAVNVVGTVFALFVAGYTGVLLSVSNQPIWSDSWALGGLFLASGLSGAAALVALFARRRRGAEAAEPALAEIDAYFVLLELAFIAVFFVSLAVAGELVRAIGMPWFLLWLVALLSLVPPLRARYAGGFSVGGGGSAALSRAAISPAVVSVMVLVGVLSMRAAVIWAAQG